MDEGSVASILCREIIDSRGNPTVEVDVELADGSLGRAAVPSGASTGTHEAHELRDGDRQRYNGKGVLQALANIADVIAPKIVGMPATDQAGIDQTLIDLDGTENKGNLGANATLGISLAVARAAAVHTQRPLHEALGNDSVGIMPAPMFNIINGGQHANNAIDFQEFMVMPLALPTFAEALRAGCEIFHALKELLDADSHSTAVGDEGGFAPNLPSCRDALGLIDKAIEKAGYRPGEDVWLGLDCASSEYFRNDFYDFAGEGKQRTAEENVEYLVELVEAFPIISIEDGCSEDDWDGWGHLTETLGGRCQLVGDDLFVTNQALLKTGIARKCANSILIKVNQIGTLTETLQTMATAEAAGYTQVMSHRSGETEDVIIADLAVATGCGQIKAGSLSRSDRLAKYNQLLRIEQELGGRARYAGKAALAQLG